MTIWYDLAKKFQKLSEITSADKSSSYSFNINYSLNGGIFIELGCYDIGDWPRHLSLGPFNTEQEALEATLKKIDEATLIVNQGEY